MEHTLSARYFACIYISFFLDLDDSWVGTSFPRGRVAFVPVLDKRVCLEALEEEDPGWFSFGHILGNLRQTVTQL